MLENDMYIAVISQAVLELLSVKVGSGNHLMGILLLQKLSGLSAIRAHIKAINVIIEKFQRQSQRRSKYTSWMHSIVWFATFRNG